MNARVPADALADTKITTVFRSGNSQAVRIPKEFQFDSKEVTIQRRGDELVLKPRYRTIGELLQSLPKLTPEEADEWDRVMAAAREQMPPLEHRPWFDERDADEATTLKAKPAAKRARRNKPSP